MPGKALAVANAPVPPQFAFAATIGLFKAVIGLILLFAVNQIARRLDAASLW